VRKDNQIDTKVDHNLTPTNRFFVRYSSRRPTVSSRRRCARRCRRDFGAGLGDIKGQSLAFNDTQTFFEPLAERVPHGLVVDQVPHDADRLRHQSGERRGAARHQPEPDHIGMTQLTFQNIRNLGANSNQPLITNQNDFQFFDNVTYNRGKHTVKMGGSFTPRSREILNADTIVGQFGFNNNMTSNCAGQGAAAP